MKQYHFTYDITDSDNYAEHKEHLLYLLHLTNYESIKCHTESTFIITYNYEIESIKLFNFLELNLAGNIYYSISKISKYSNENVILSENKDKELNKRFQKELASIDFGVLKLIYKGIIEKF